jgi:hypothetical protein
MKRMSTFTLNDIREAFRGKLWCFVPVTGTHCPIALGVAVANEAGYSPLPETFCNADTWNDMEAYADELNTQMGISDEESIKIVGSTMFKMVRFPTQRVGS